MAILEYVKNLTGLNRSFRTQSTVSMMMRPLIFLGFYLALAALTFRGLNTYFSDDHDQRWVAVGLLSAFFILSVTCYWLTRRLWWYPHLYMTLQGGLTLGLLLLSPHLDYLAILYFLLSAQAMLLFSRQTGYLWLGSCTLAMAGALIYASGWRDALPLILLYGAGFYFFGSFATLTAQAEADRAELQEAHMRLQEYSTQAQELAVAQERNRLARDLHDSVTQSIFSMTLTAESARILLERDPARTAPQLARLQELAQGALEEMRSLIYQLRPADLADEGLVPAIHNHLATLKSREGLIVELHVEGEGRLPRDQGEGLLRIVQEALNNVSKHAQTKEAVVTLRMIDGLASLLIEDQGTGFDPTAIDGSKGHLGLASMRERAEMQGGKFEAESHPEQGTRILVGVPYIEGR